MSDVKEKIDITEHLTELRSRLIKSFCAVLIGFAICYFFKEKLFFILTQPLRESLDKSGSIIFTGIPEAFFTYLKTALLTGVIITLPYTFFQFWAFISPGLYSKERKITAVLTVLSVLFFACGALFGYFFVFPYGFDFLLSFADKDIQALPSMKEYFSFASKLLFAFGLSFELPLVLTGLAKMGVVTPDFLKKKRKYAILFFFCFAAFITPPDVITQTMMALPMLLLYEVSIIGAKIFGKKKT